MFLDNLRISRKLTIGFAAVILTMTGMGASTFYSLRSLETAREQADQSRQMITALEQAKFFLEDPSHNIIEVKAYREPRAAIGGSEWEA